MYFVLVQKMNFSAQTDLVQKLKRLNLYFWSQFKFKNSDAPQTFDSSDTGPSHILCFSAENELE